MGKQRRGKGDLAFDLPRGTYEKTPVDDRARADPHYRPAVVMYSDLVCNVCQTVIPAGTDARWASGRRMWRHGDCRWDLTRLNKHAIVTVRI